jgi:hypothetical protein
MGGDPGMGGPPPQMGGPPPQMGGEGGDLPPEVMQAAQGIMSIQDPAHLAVIAQLVQQKGEELMGGGEGAPPQGGPPMGGPPGAMPQGPPPMGM